MEGRIENGVDVLIIDWFNVICGVFTILWGGSGGFNEVIVWGFCEWVIGFCGRIWGFCGGRIGVVCGVIIGKENMGGVIGENFKVWDWIIGILVGVFGRGNWGVFLNWNIIGCLILVGGRIGFEGVWKDWLKMLNFWLVERDVIDGFGSVVGYGVEDLGKLIIIEFVLLFFWILIAWE